MKWTFSDFTTYVQNKIKRICLLRVMTLKAIGRLEGAVRPHVPAELSADFLIAQAMLMIDVLYSNQTPLHK